MASKVYIEYLNKVDSYLGINTNPKLRDDIVRYLNYVLDDYKAIEYDKEHYEAMYEEFLNTIVSQAEAGDLNGLTTSYYNLFNPVYQEKLSVFSKTMDMIANIHEINTNEKIKDKALGLYKMVYLAPHLSLSAIDSYKEKFEIFNDCLNEIGNFVNQTVYYHVDYFTAYINKIIDDLMHYACMFELENVKSKIDEVNDSDLNNALCSLSNVLDKLKTIKEGSYDYIINDKIDSLFKEIEEEWYLTTYAIQDFGNRANDLIHEYRYG